MLGELSVKDTYAKSCCSKDFAGSENVKFHAVLWSTLPVDAAEKGRQETVHQAYGQIMLCSASYNTSVAKNHCRAAQTCHQERLSVLEVVLCASVSSATFCKIQDAE